MLKIIEGHLSTLEVVFLELKLNKKLKTFKERLEYIENEIFAQDKFKEYFGLYEHDNPDNPLKSFSAKEFKDLDKRWLGINGGKEKTSVPVSHILDMMANYLISTKETSKTEGLKRYKDLKKIGEDRTEEQNEEYKKLKKKVIYHNPKGKNKDLVFFHNEPCERFLKKRVKEIKEEDWECKESRRNVLAKLMLQSNTARRIRSEAKEASERMKENHREVDKIKEAMRNEYERYKIDRNHFVVDSIVEMSAWVKRLQEETEYLECRISDLYDEYVMITEFKQGFN